MKKVLVSLLSIALIGCSQPILSNTSQYSDLDKEYSQFTTKALTQSYLKKKMDKWLSDAKYSKNLVREIEYAKFKHKDLLKDIVALEPTMFDGITANTAVTTKRIESPFENYIEYIDPYPSAVTANNATNVTTSSFTANWTSNTKASSYKLFVNGSEVYSGVNTSFDVTNLSFGTTPTYYVKAVNSAGTSPNSNTISVTLNPDIVTALDATDLTQTSFTANWSSLTGATSYKLKVDNGAFTDVGNVTSKSITGLTIGSSHTYSVQAVNAGGTGSSSNIITVNLNPAVPAVPTTLVATNIGQTSFTANWNSVTNASSYKLKVDNGAYVDVGAVTSFDVTGLTIGTVTAGSSHNYYVQASNISGTSAGSTARAVTLLPATPSAPVATIASSVTSTSFRANWSSVSGATGYKLYIDGSLAYTGTNLYYDKSSVVSGSSHTYYVQAYNTGGTSANSNEISVSIITNLTQIQSIGTYYYTPDVESFTIGTDRYLAFANYFDGSSYNIDSNIYKWNSTTSQFETFQNIGAGGGCSWKHFMIGTDHYLALVNHNNGSSVYINSKIYKWNGSQFVFIQNIFTSAGSRVNYFTKGVDSYLVFTNYYGGSSNIYKWNSVTNQFDLFQSMSTSGSIDSNEFTIASNTYIAFTNYEGTTTDIYKWNNTTNKFDTTTYQSMSITTSRDLEEFTIGTDSYLAISSDSGNSYIYKWNTSTSKFNTTPFQTFSTDTVYSMKFFTLGSDSYLATANYNSNSKIYKWNGTTFALWQTVGTSNNANDWEFFTVGNKNYLAIARDYGTSYIYRLD